MGSPFFSFTNLFLKNIISLLCLFGPAVKEIFMRVLLVKNKKECEKQISVSSIEYPLPWIATMSFEFEPIYTSMLINECKDLGDRNHHRLVSIIEALIYGIDYLLEFYEFLVGGTPPKVIISNLVKNPT